MKTVLVKRNLLIKELLPWDDVNYGADDQWSWVYPYGQKTKPGETVECTIKLFNYSDKAKSFTLEPNVPAGFRLESKVLPLFVEPRAEGTRTFKVKVSKKAESGISVVTVNVKFDDLDLREWSESFIEVVR